MLEKYTSEGIQVVYKLYTNQVYNLPWVYSVENVYNKYSLVYSAYHAFSDFFRVHTSMRVVCTSIQKVCICPKKTPFLSQNDPAPPGGSLCNVCCSVKKG